MTYVRDIKFNCLKRKDKHSNKEFYIVLDVYISRSFKIVDKIVLLITYSIFQFIRIFFQYYFWSLKMDEEDWKEE